MLFVMNPNSGMRKANRYLVDIISLFNEAGYDVNIYMTAAQGDATRIVRECAADKDIVVCCGGDGTLNETISGLLQADLHIPVGYIPAGTTNDFASSLKIPSNIMQAAQDIVNGVPVEYDVGKFGDRYFAYIASFGAFTKSSYATPQPVKNALGHAAYVLEGISELAEIHTSHVRVETENRIVEDDFLFGCISNSVSVGGVLELDPNQVDLRDGRVEILLVRAPSNLTELAECLQALQSQQYEDSPLLTFCSSEWVNVTADPNMPWTLDGEKFDGCEQIRVQNLARALQLIQRVESND